MSSLVRLVLFILFIKSVQIVVKDLIVAIINYFLDTCESAISADQAGNMWRS